MFQRIELSGERQLVMEGIMKRVMRKGRLAQLFLVLLVCCFAAVTQAATVVETDVTTAGDGNVLLGVEGTYITQIDDALDLINSYRLEACQEGVINPATNEPLTTSDYVPIQWSGDLEYTARIRAAESLFTIAHIRTNGDRIYNLTSPNGVRFWGECLAYNGTKSMLSGIVQWYGEKADWVNKTGGVTGHYTAMIDPTNTHIGLGTFYSSKGYYKNCTAASFSKAAYGATSSSRIANPGEVIQILEFPESAITGYTLVGETSGQGGDTVEYTFYPTITMNSGSADLIIPSGISWRSSSASVASIDSDGVLKVTGCGDTTVSATWNGTTKSLTFTSNHIWDDGRITTPAHCETAGVKTFTCKTCGDTYTEGIAATGHAFDSGMITTEAHCETAGVRTYTCTNTNCNTVRKTRTESIAATGHAFDSGIITTEAHCETAGVRTYTCINTNCNAERKTRTESVAATGHTFDDGRITTPAGCETTGVKTYTCTNTNCNTERKTKTESVAATGHSWNAGEVTTEATCAHAGVRTFTCINEHCGTVQATRTEVIEKLTVHTWNKGDVTTVAGCTTAGIRTYTCTVCGEKKTDRIPSAGHSYITQTQAATCTEAGKKTTVCSVCGNVSKTETIAATGHRFNGGIITQVATTTNTGVKTYTCTTCRITKTETIAKLPTKPAEEQTSTPTTPVETEKMTETQEVPDTHVDETEYEEPESESPCDHSWGSGVVTRAATCKTAGVRTYTCSRCKAAKTETIPADGAHTWDAGKVTTEATTSKAGVKTYTCTVCKTTKTETIAKLAETPISKDAVSPSNPAAATAVAKAVTSQKSDSDPKGSTFSLLQAKGSAKSNTSNKITWTKVKSATAYIVYGNKCGKNNRFKQIARVKGTSYTHKKLKKGTYYKYLVVAVKGSKALATSKTIHVTTKGGKYGNDKSVSLNKTKVTLKKGKTFKLKAKAVAQSKKLKVKKHRSIKYESSNPAVATVSSKGVIKAKAKGTCKIYAYAQNGVYKAITVKVK